MVTEVQWSELRRDPKQVAQLADAGAVRVRRRDGAPLLLLREDRADVASEGSVTAARALLRNVLVHLPPDIAAQSLLDEFPWVECSPANEQAQFVRDFARAFQASAELGEWSVLAQTIREWRATAAIHSDPTLAAQLSGPVGGDFGPVPAPIEE